jgi:tetratricopeptide (TPR) repeat protein
LQSAATVLNSEVCRRPLSESFVLVRLAAPTLDASAGSITETTTWAQRLGVASFPTFILLDSQAKPYAKSELVATTSEKYQEEFRRLQQVRTNRDLAMTQADAAQGIERAKLLDKALGEVASFADTEYADVERKIVDLDSKNAAGLKAKYESTVATREIDAVIQNEVYPLADRANYRAAITRIDRLISDIKPPRPQLQLLTAFKGQLYFSLGDKRRGAQVLDEAIAIDPQSESAARARAAKAQLLGAS